MTLPEFLLARIAEDENGPFLNAWHVGRVRGECAAKHGIIDLFPHADEIGYGLWASAGASVLRQLATVYADHPDYDPAWAA